MWCVLPGRYLHTSKFKHVMYASHCLIRWLLEPSVWDRKCAVIPLQPTSRQVLASTIHSSWRAVCLAHWGNLRLKKKGEEKGGSRRRTAPRSPRLVLCSCPCVEAALKASAPSLFGFTRSRRRVEKRSRHQWKARDWCAECPHYMHCTLMSQNLSFRVFSFKLAPRIRLNQIRSWLKTKSSS